MQGRDDTLSAVLVLWSTEHNQPATSLTRKGCEDDAVRSLSTTPELILKTFEQYCEYGSRSEAKDLHLRKLVQRTEERHGPSQT